MMHRSIYKLFSSRLVGWFCKVQWPHPIVQFVIRALIKHYQIDVSQLLEPLDKFKSVDAFFTRKMNPSFRPISTNALDIITPCDGLIQQFGDLQDNQLLQVKGMPYSVDKLIPCEWSSKFRNGRFIAFYLSPKDCHLVFAPIQGQVIESCHIPGSLHLVRESYLVKHAGVYVESERLISLLDTEIGVVAIVKVGAIRVGNITTTYDPLLHTNLITSKITRKTYVGPILVNRGDHLGTFHLGSTVILLFEKNRIDWIDNLNRKNVLYGQKFAQQRARSSGV